MTSKDSINDFDYNKDFNEAFSNIDEQRVDENSTSLDPVIERRSISPANDLNSATTVNSIIDNETVIQMITGNNSIDLEEMKAQQNFPMAILGGILASVVCIFIWAIITVATKYQITYMAIAVGVVIGLAIQKFGKGLTPVYGILGAVLALIACFCGNIISYTCLEAELYEGYSYLNAISDLNFNGVLNLSVSTFELIDLLFYGLAIYTGYTFSIKQIK